MKGKEKQEKAKMVQEVADDKMVEGKDTAKEKKDKASKGKGKKDPEDEDEVSRLIWLLEERPTTIRKIFETNSSFHVK